MENNTVKLVIEGGAKFSCIFFDPVSADIDFADSSALLFGQVESHDVSIKVVFKKRAVDIEQVVV